MFQTDFQSGFQPPSRTNHPADAYHEAWRLLEDRDPRQALALLDPAIEKEPQSASLRTLRAWAYFQSAQLQRAEQELAVLVEDCPTDVWARFASRPGARAAVEVLRRASAAAPRRGDVRRRRARGRRRCASNAGSPRPVSARTTTWSEPQRYSSSGAVVPSPEGEGCRRLPRNVTSSET